MEDLFQQAEVLYKNKDPACVELYKKDNSWTSRTKLAMIYSEGKCGQRIDYDKALEYTRGNKSFLAQAIEARIMVFEKCHDELAGQYFLILFQNHLKKENHAPTNIVLSDFYLQGKGVEIDFDGASRINPKLLELETFSRVFSKMTKSAQDALESDLIAKGHTIGKALIAQTREKLSNPPSCTATTTSEYYDKITALTKEKNYDEAASMAIEWFTKEKNESSAYALLKNATLTINDQQYDEAVSILKPLSSKPHNLKRLIYASREKEKWDDFKQYMAILKEPTVEYAYGWAVYYEITEQKNRACQCYLRSVRYNEKTHELTTFSIKALKRAFALDPTMVIWYPKYAEDLLKFDKPSYKYLVASAWIDYGNIKEKDNGKQILETIADKHLDSAKKLYSLTGDAKYIPIINKLTQLEEYHNSAHFDYNDSTEKILGYLHDLPPLRKIVALETLATRYLYGKTDVPKDFQKASQFLLDEIKLCEQQHRSAKFPKAKLGLMMYDKKIPVIDKKMMFDFIYPLRNSTTYTSAVSECLLTGTGTEVDVSQALELLNLSKSQSSLKKLLKLYSDGVIIPRNPNRMYAVASEFLRNYEPTQYAVSTLDELIGEKVDFYPEISFGEYKNAKIRSLITAGKACNDPKDSIRYFDFARNLGDYTAAVQEALVILKTFKNQRLAYSILRTANVDPLDNVYSRIHEGNEVMVDIDEELRYLLG